MSWLSKSAALGQLELFPSLTQSLLSQSTSAENKTASPEKAFRTVQLDGRLIEYEFRRSRRRRSIGFLVNHSGLRVTAPVRASLSRIDSAILDKKQWIISKLDYFRDNPDLASSPKPIADGAVFNYLGDKIQLRIKTSTNNHVYLDHSKKTLMVLTAQPEGKDKLNSQLQAWFQKEARKLFDSRMPYFANKLAVMPQAMTLSSAKYRWGSCSAQGRICLNWKLVQFPVELIDYVIVHELAHLKELNHSKRFWDVVSRVYPDYQQARQRMRQLSLREPFLF